MELTNKLTNEVLAPWKTEYFNNAVSINDSMKSIVTSFDGAATEYFDVYLVFKADGSFEMYQRLYTLNYEYYAGSYNVSGDIVTGNYDDGKNWLTGYKAEVSADGKTLTMYSQEDVSLTTVYTAEAVPVEIKAEAKTTRSADSERFL